MRFASTPPFDGTLAGFYKLPADMCYPLSFSVSLEEGALIEPLAVGVMAITTIGQMPLGANVVGEYEVWALLPSTLRLTLDSNSLRSWTCRPAHHGFGESSRRSSRPRH